MSSSGWQSALEFLVTELEAGPIPTSIRTDTYSRRRKRSTCSLISTVKLLPLVVNMIRSAWMWVAGIHEGTSDSPAALQIEEGSLLINQETNLWSQSKRRIRCNYLQEGNMLSCFPHGPVDTGSLKHLYKLQLTFYPNTPRATDHQNETKGHVI